MDNVHYFLLLASGIPAWMLRFFPITLLVAGSWIFAVVASRRCLRKPDLSVLLMSIVPGVLTFGVLATGVIFRQTTPPWGAEDLPTFPVYLLNGFLVAHLPLGGWLAWRSREQWSIVAASSGLWFWASVCASFEAGMSVTGVWL